MTKATEETWVAQDVEETYVDRRPRRRRGGGGALFLLILLVLAAILVVGDRVAEKMAANELRSQVVTELDKRDVAYSSIGVSIGGFPFLTQVARGRYDEIAIDMTDVKLPAGTTRAATLPGLNVIARGVIANTADLVQGKAQVTAEEVTGTAVVSYATLQSLIDFSRFNLADVKFAEDKGALKASGTATLAGVRVPITATADISVRDGQFRIQLRDATAATLPVPQVVQNYLSNLAEQAAVARLPQLPFGLTLDAASVHSDGLAITATGRDVPLVQ